MYQHASTLILGLTIPTAFGGSASKLNHYAKAGTCENVATGARRCALTPSDCEPTHIDGEKHINGEKWFSAYRLVQKDGQPCTCEKTRVNACFSNNCSGPNCGWTLADVHDGANTGFRCAANSASCALSKGEVFGQLEDDTLAEGAQCGCNALMKPGEQESSDKLSVGNQRATLYGACYKDSDNVFCAYSPDDCGDDGYSWLDPLSASDILGYDCACADTHIGGCVGGFMGFMCAVSEHDCTWDTYYPPMTLAGFGYNCRLCEGRKLPNLDTIDKVVNRTTMSEESFTPTIVVIIASGAVGVATGIALSLVVMFICRKCNQKKLDSSKITFKTENTEVA